MNLKKILVLLLITINFNSHSSNDTFNILMLKADKFTNKILDTSAISGIFLFTFLQFYAFVSSSGKPINENGNGKTLTEGAVPKILSYLALYSSIFCLIARFCIKDVICKEILCKAILKNLFNRHQNHH